MAKDYDWKDVLRGADALATKVGGAMGPAGKPVKLGRGVESRLGYVIADCYRLDDAAPEHGAEFGRGAAQEIRNRIEGGTSPAAVLTAGLLDCATEALIKGGKRDRIRFEIESSVEEVLRELDRLREP